MSTFLHASVVFEYMEADAPQSVLLPEERAAIMGAAPLRIAEYASVRACARRALGRLGYPAGPIVPGKYREPQWPQGIVGSLTHCEGYRAAAVARKSEVLAIGIDAELNKPLPEGVTEMVTVGAESQMLAHLFEIEPTIAWDRLLFSAKESIYKAWFPLSGIWLDFKECELTIHVPSRTFIGKVLIPGVKTDAGILVGFNGTWTIYHRWIVTAVWDPIFHAPAP